MGDPQNGWFSGKILFKWMIYGCLHFRKPPYILTTHHMLCVSTLVFQASLIVGVFKLSHRAWRRGKCGKPGMMISTMPPKSWSVTGLPWWFCGRLSPLSFSFRRLPMPRTAASAASAETARDKPHMFRSISAGTTLNVDLIKTSYTSFH